MHDSTKIIRSTLTRVTPGEPLHPSPVFAAPYHTPGDPADAPYSYARSHNPTWTALEKALGQMESGQFAPGHADAGKSYRASALVFASGMAACASIFGAVLRPGDVAVLPENAYFAARVLMQDYFAKMGVVVRLAPTAGDAQGEHLEGARLLWIETPSNPTMEICDIACALRKGACAGALVAVDNTTATAARPAAARAWRGLLRRLRHQVDDRPQRHSARPRRLPRSRTAAEDRRVAHADGRRPRPHGGVARAAVHRHAAAAAGTQLRQRPAHRRVPDHAPRGLERALPRPAHSSRPRHRRAPDAVLRRVLSFSLADKAAAETFFSKAKLITEATSFGGTCTCAERRARWGGDAVPEGFIRLSAGLEHIDDLLADIAQALDGLTPASGH
jgi:cystathionine gamma-lyase